MLVELPATNIDANSLSYNDDPAYWIKLVDNHKEHSLKVLSLLKIAITQLTPPHPYDHLHLQS
jgi:hypothetical protein